LRPAQPYATALGNPINVEPEVAMVRIGPFDEFLFDQAVTMKKF